MIAVLFLLGLLASVHGEKAQRVATFNVRNYLIQDRMVDGRWREDYPKPENEKAALRATIAAMDADILALQEMGPRPFLLELRKDLVKEGVDYPYAVHLEAEDRQRHLAVLSRIEPLRVIRHLEPDFPYRGERLRIKRGLLEVVFPGTGEVGEWSLFVVHLKSRWSDFDEDPLSSERRRKEARAARDRILVRHPNAEGFYLIAGDMNDHPASAPLRRFLQIGDLRIAYPLDARDSRGHTWTFHYPREDRYERVDYILVSPQMRDYVSGGAAEIFDGPYVLDSSDHRPLWVDLFGTRQSGLTFWRGGF